MCNPPPQPTSKLHTKRYANENDLCADEIKYTDSVTDISALKQLLCVLFLEKHIKITVKVISKPVVSLHIQNMFVYQSTNLL